MPLVADVSGALSVGNSASGAPPGQVRVNDPRSLVLKLDCVGSAEVIGRLAAHFSAANLRIDEIDNHADPATGRIFIRLILHDVLGRAGLAWLRAGFAPIAAGLGSDTRWRFSENGGRARIVVLVSGEMHCLRDVLDKTQDGRLPATVVGVVGNHVAAAAALEDRDVPFHHIEFPARDAVDRIDRRAEAFDRVAQVVDAYDPDVIVLARFMQILPPELCRRWTGRAINIHHSILPSFVGASPYRQAHTRGVKVVGATCHYVTPDLDAGPIIEQDVIRVNHADTVVDMMSKGREVECAVLSRGLQWHLEDRVFVNGDSTVVLADSTSSRTRSA